MNNCVKGKYKFLELLRKIQNMKLFFLSQLNKHSEFPYNNGVTLALP